MPTFKLTIEAKKDLENIAKYTEQEWGIEQRNKYLTMLDSRMYWLADNPQLGMDRSDIKKGYYSYPEGMHVIFYTKLEDYIAIIGILHQTMDVKRHL